MDGDTTGAGFTDIEVKAQRAFFKSAMLGLFNMSQHVKFSRSAIEVLLTRTSVWNVNIPQNSLKGEEPAGNDLLEFEIIIKLKPRKSDGRNRPS